ncbi:MAG TPA: 1-acyl-sn-glycerol-3-phosphate acyltransferase, partial [Stenomitos sp.]
FHDSWLDSGDLAYFAKGDVYVTGRVKDVIIRGGRHLFPYELEEAIGDLPGIRKGCVAVIGTQGPVTGTERLVVIAETREQDPDERRRLVKRINAATLGLLGEPPDEVVLAPPHAVLKTSSGKIRHSAIRELYERGELVSGRAVWLQVLRLGISGLGPGIRRSLRSLGEVLYSLYAWLVFGLISPIGWLLAVSLPRLSWRRGIVRALARVLARLLGLRIRVHGAEHLAGCPPCVLVANHASYFDALVLAATMPLEVTYVPKREFTRHALTRIFFDRLGARYVARVDPRQAVEDAKRLSEVVRQGESLFVFPEGGFIRETGLRPFHMGAFLVAAEQGVPVVPTSLRGTRSLLRARSRFVRRGIVYLTISPPLVPEGRDLAAAVKLRDASFEAVLRHSGELAIEPGERA